MFRLLADDAVLLHHETAIHDFPRQLLHVVATQPRQHVRYLTTWMHHWLPIECNYADVHDWVTQCLSWFSDHGHLQRERGGGYTCMPPYAVGGMSHPEGKTYLYGHPDGRGWIEQHGCPIISQIVTDSETARSIGYHQLFTVNAQQQSIIEQRINIISLKEIEDSLPRIDELQIPDLAHARLLPSDGIYEVYEPRYPNQRLAQCWRIRDTSLLHSNCLVRWRDHPATDRYTARYFYQHFASSGVELSYEQAVMWRWKIDAALQPRSMLWHAGTDHVWLSSGLPASYWQWLRLIAPSEPEQADGYWKLAANTTIMDRIRTMLETRLGIICQPYIRQ